MSSSFHWIGGSATVRTNFIYDNCSIYERHVSRTWLDWIDLMEKKYGINFRCLDLRDHSVHDSILRPGALFSSTFQFKCQIYKPVRWHCIMYIYQVLLKDVHERVGENQPTETSRLVYSAIIKHPILKITIIFVDFPFKGGSMLWTKALESPYQKLYGFWFTTHI